ncbi:MAG: hypothetical protein L6Q84_03020 [Polyangiaceae bacterium]|nr:hypothetical protein [Polyangiaceae bacterium]
MPKHSFVVLAVLPVALSLAACVSSPEAGDSGPLPTLGQQSLGGIAPANGGGQPCIGKCAPNGVSVQEIEGGLRLVHEGACLVTDIQGELSRTASLNAIVIEGTATSVNVRPCPAHFSTQGDEPEIRLKGKAWLPSNFVVVAFEKALDLTLDGVSLVADANSRALACGAGT